MTRFWYESIKQESRSINATVRDVIWHKPHEVRWWHPRDWWRHWKTPMWIDLSLHKPHEVRWWHPRDWWRHWKTRSPFDAEET